MKKLVPILFLFGCTSSKSDESVGYFRENSSTDTIHLPEIGMNLMFNSYGLFDTSYATFHIDMCGYSSGNRYANSKYTCTDTFGFLEPIIRTDTALYMSYNLSTDTKATIVDSIFLQRGLDKRKILLKAIGLEPNEYKGELKTLHGFKYGSFTLIDTIFENVTNLQYGVTFVQDSVAFSLSFHCFAQDCGNKIEEFEKIVQSIRCKRQ